ncbi:MAG: Porphobilinogen synthase, partial [uncultured Sphingomonas sp.]
DRLLSRPPHAPRPLRPMDARDAGRAPAAPERPHLAIVHLRRRGLRGADPIASGGEPVDGRPARPAGAAGGGRGDPVRGAVPEHAAGPPHRGCTRGAEPREPDLLGHQGDQGRGAEHRRADRRRARPLYQPRPRRTDRRRWPGRQRSYGRNPRAPGAGPGRSRGRHRRPVRHDGRPRRGDPRCLGRRGPPACRNHGLCRQICLGILRPVPRCGGLVRAPEGRQARLSDEPGQRRRSPARGRTRPCGGRRHGDGQARPALPRRAGPREGRVRRSDLRLPGERRICDDRGRRGRGCRGPRRPDAGDVAGLQTRRRDGGAQLPRTRRCPADQWL